jgi:peroxiredoxin
VTRRSPIGSGRLLILVVLVVVAVVLPAGAALLGRGGDGSGAGPAAPPTSASTAVQTYPPGTPAKALRLPGLDGPEVDLAALRGRPVVVNFWATWCEPCREEMPSIERLRASLEGRPFAVLAVNLAEPESRIRKFLDTMPLGFAVLLDRDAKVARAWQAKMLPATYIVGPDGVIRFQHRGELDWSKPEVRRQIAALMK